VEADRPPRRPDGADALAREILNRDCLDSSTDPNTPPPYHSGEVAQRDEYHELRCPDGMECRVMGRRGTSALDSSTMTRVLPICDAISRRAARLDFCRDRSLEVLARHFEIVVGLEVQPEFRTVAEIESEAHRSFGTYPPPVVYNFSDPIRRYSDRLRELVFRAACTRRGIPL